MRKAVLLLLLCVSACSFRPKPVNLSYLPDRTDGSYQGWAYLTSAPGMVRARWWTRPTVDDEVCPHTTYGVITIGDHTLYYAYAPNLIFSLTVQPDGTLYQKLGNATLSGHVSHGRMTFNVVTPICTTRFFGDFIRNHS